jgi:mannose-6-phosphate isomerase
MKLTARYVEKPWGRQQLPQIFAGAGGKRIGEVWLVGGDELPLLVKYIFTSEKLSVQVHPDDRQAKQRGLASGKAECWYILDAEPGATIGLGLRREVSKEELRSAALDGSMEALIDWRSVKAGDTFDVSPGTIHSIGGGISLVEFQQNADVTYRLYDFGRPRALHLEDAIAVADRRPFDGARARHVVPGDDVEIVDGPHFTLVHAHQDRFQDRQRWVVPLEGEVRAGGEVARAGECLIVTPGQRVELERARLLIGAAA